MNLQDLKKTQKITILIAVHAVVLLLTLFFLIRQKGETVPAKEEIVVIPIEGVISMKAGSLGRGQSVDSIVKYLNKLRERDEVKAVVLRINSPGGSVGAVQEIYRALKKFKEKGKYIVSSFGDISASGGVLHCLCWGQYYFQPRIHYRFHWCFDATSQCTRPP